MRHELDDRVDGLAHVRVYGRAVRAVVEHHFLDIRQRLARPAAGLQKYGDLPAEPLMHEALMVGAHGNDQLSAGEDVARQRAPAMGAHIEALFAQVIAHVRTHDMRIVVRARRADGERALRPELAAQGIFRRKAAENVSGTYEQNHCGLMPETRTMRCAASISLSTKRLNSLGVMAIGSAPSRARRSRPSAAAATRPGTPAVRSVVAGGGPAGAPRPFHQRKPNP